MTTTPRRPQVTVSGRHLRDISNDAWAALVAANDPPVLFRRGQMLVDIIRADDDQPLLRVLDKAALKGILDRNADFVSRGRSGLGPARPPVDVVADMMSVSEIPLPMIQGITEVPVFAPSGALINAPGYNPETRMYLEPAKGLTIPPIPDHPSDADIAKARSLLLDDLLVNFPFVSDSDKTHALALYLLPYVRPLIKGPTPLHLIESPTAGTGKDRLANVIAIPATGRSLASMTEGRDEDEWRKRITSKLSQGTQFFLIANVTHRLDSAAISEALTVEIWEDRLLGKSQIISVPVRCVWIATANNPTVSFEIARRAISIRLDSGLERPFERTEFKHQLPQWAFELRGKLIWAGLTLVKAWVAAGMPAGKKTLGSFEDYARVMGGILEVVNVSGFLEDRDRVFAEADLEVTAWTEFCHAWWREFGQRKVTAGQLFGLATRERLLLEVWSGGEQHSAHTRFGKALSKMRDRVIGEFRIRQTGLDSHKGVQTYQLERVKVPSRSGVAGVSGVYTTPEKSEAEAKASKDSFTGVPETPATPADPRPDDDVLEV